MVQSLPCRTLFGASFSLRELDGANRFSATGPHPNKTETRHQAFDVARHAIHNMEALSSADL
jgi:hypothetical protein